MNDIRIRDLKAIEEFRQVVELEKAIWGYADPGDLVTIPVFIFTVKRGATLIGAFDDANRLVGFAYAVVGMKDGRPMHWSHMAGVLPEHRGGLGYRLKIEQRTRVARRELVEHAASLAVGVARTKIRAQITDADQSRLVDRYLAEVTSHE